MLAKMMIALAPFALATDESIEKIRLTEEYLQELQSSDEGLKLNLGETVKLVLSNGSCCDEDWKVPDI